MSERCSNCGAEFVAGQQFCRRCGAALRRAGDEAQTQLFPQGVTGSGPVGNANSGPVNNSGPVDSAQATGTSPLEAGARTDAVGPQAACAYRQPPGAYQPPVADFQQTSPLVGQPFNSRPLYVQPGLQTPRKSRRGLWLVALLVVFVLGVGAIGGAGYMLWRARHPKVIVHRGSGGTDIKVPDIPEVPAIPPDLGDKIRDAMKAAGIAQPLDESGATITGTDTVVTKTFDIDDDATFSITGVSGKITITGTDGNKAEVKITKHGGSPQERSNARIVTAQTDERLSFMTAAPPAGVEVAYEVKLPRELHQINITSAQGDVKVSDFGGSVNVNLREGDLEFHDVTGSVSSKLVNGDTKIFYGSGDREGGQEFSAVKGNIEATIPDGADADLKAETINGDISVDDRYGFKAEKRPAGREVKGKLGDGGPPIQLKTITGDIKLKK